MKAVAEVVPGQLILLAVDGDEAILDTIRIAADGCSEVGLVPLGIIILEVVEAQHYVAENPVAVRHQQRDYASAVIGDADLHPGIVLQSVKFGAPGAAQESRGQAGHY